MATDYWALVITAGGALVGSLGGVGLTLRHQRWVHEQDRAEERRDAARRQYTDLLLHAREWDMAQGKAFSYAQRATDIPPTNEKEREWLGERLVESHETAAAAARRLMLDMTAATMLSSDPLLREAVGAYSTTFSAALIESARQTYQASEDATARRAYADAMARARAGADLLREVSEERLAVPLQAEDRRRHWSLRRREREHPGLAARLDEWHAVRANEVTHMPDEKSAGASRETSD